MRNAHLRSILSLSSSYSIAIWHWFKRIWAENWIIVRDRESRCGRRSECPISSVNRMMTKIRCLLPVECERATLSFHWLIHHLRHFHISHFHFLSPLLPSRRCTFSHIKHRLNERGRITTTKQKQNCEMTCKMPNSIVLIKLRIHEERTC